MQSLQRVNMDSTWLVKANGITLLLDPWILLDIPEIDGFSLLSSQKLTIAPLDIRNTHIDAIVISMAFSDHCHEESLLALNPTIPLYCEKGAAQRLLRHPLLKNRTIQLIETFPAMTTCKTLRLAIVPTTGLLDFVHSGLLLKPGEWRGGGLLYCPHGYHCTELTRCNILQQLRNMDLDVLLTTATEYALPLLLGGTVNLGLQNMKDLSEALCPRFVLDTHSEQKEATGLVAAMANPTYPSTAEMQAVPCFYALTDYSVLSLEVGKGRRSKKRKADTHPAPAVNTVQQGRNSRHKRRRSSRVKDHTAKKT